MFSLIVAISQNNVIGEKNKLLWHLPEDLKRFKNITSGHTIAMGRKTFESLPGVLPNRKHVIFSKNINLNSSSNSVEICTNLDEFIDDFKDSNEEIFIIGGGEIYNYLLPFCNKLYLTKIYENFEGDTKFPEIDLEKWNIVSISDKKLDEKSNLLYQFIDLSR